MYTHCIHIVYTLYTHCKLYVYTFKALLVNPGFADVRADLCCQRVAAGFDKWEHMCAPHQLIAGFHFFKVQRSEFRHGGLLDTDNLTPSQQNRRDFSCVSKNPKQLLCHPVFNVNS